MDSNRLTPIHPGEVLADFIEGSDITGYRLAKDVHVSPMRINEIVNGKRGISADTALRLDRYFGVHEGYWLGLQARYDMQIQRDKIESDLASIEPLRVAQ